MNKIMSGPVCILPRNRHVVDVFTGMAYSRHSVFRIVGGVPKIVEGPRLNNEEYSFLLGKVHEGR